MSSATHIDLREHPALRAWSELGGDRDRPVSVELRKRHPHSEVCRLVGAGPGGSTIVAKHCDAATGEVERLIYEEILPRLAISRLRCYGSLPAGDGTLWLFLEDAGEGRFSPAEPEHRRLAARWLAGLHVGAAELPELAELPGRGAAHYLAKVREVGQRIRHGAGDPSLVAEERSFLDDLAVLHERLEAAWPCLEASSPLPRTLVHGDLLRSNVRLRGDAALVFDWEMAGRGLPAVDLHFVDLATYLDAVRQAWALDLDVARLCAAADVLRNLDAVDWISPDLLLPRASWRLEPLRLHAGRLAHAASVLELA